MFNRINILALSLAALCMVGLGAWACNVPVFRYALDHWSADKYQAIVVHHGPLTSDAQTAIDQIKASIEAKQCNLALRMIDTAGELSEVDQYYVETSQIDIAETGPQMFVHYPAALQIRQPIMHCGLSGSCMSNLIDSPVRRQLLKRLSEGQSAVWMLVKGGDEEADKAAEQLLAKELRHLQATLELPKLTDDPADKIVGGPELRVEFSMLTLDRADKQEHELIEMLVSSEADLKELNEPILFAAFGRGRVLWPLVGPGITTENIREMAIFVTGACSCQVKEQNPGFDLLLKSNWEELLPWTKEPSPPLLAQDAVPELVPIPQGSNAPQTVVATSEKERSTNWFPLFIGISLAIFLPLLTRWMRKSKIGY